MRSNRGTVTPTRGRKRKRYLLLTLILGGCLVGWSWVEAHLILQVKEIRVQIPHLGTLPPDYIIAQISDIHLREPGPRENLLVRKLRDLEPDLLLFTGDYVGGYLEDLSPKKRDVRLIELEKVMAEIHGTCSGSSIAVLGNHDTDPAITSILRRVGIKVLRNQSTLLETPGGPLQIVGMDAFDLPLVPIDPKADRFEATELLGSKAFVTSSERRDLFCHWVGAGADELLEIDIQADLYFESPQGEISLLAGSRIPWDEDGFYGIGRASPYRVPDGSRFHFTWKGHQILVSSRGLAEKSVSQTWYRARLRLERTGESILLQGKTWRRDEPEPDKWRLKGVDEHIRRPASGTFGIRTRGPGKKAIDNVVVRDLDGTLLYQQTFDSLPGDWEEGPRRSRLDVAMSGIDPALPTIALIHVPDHGAWAGTRGAHLILAGDTHGGQIEFPFRKWIVQKFLGPDRLTGKYIRGRYKVPGAAELYVTRGIGTSWLPLRFLCPPELTVLRPEPVHPEEFARPQDTRFQ